MRTRPTCAGPVGTGSSGLVSPVEKRSEFGLEGDIGRIEHLAARHDDDVDPPRWFVVAEQVPNQALGSVPDDGRAHFPGGGDTKSRSSPSIGTDEHRHQAP